MSFPRRTFLAGAESLAALSILPVVAFARGRQPKYVIPVDWDGFDPDYLGRTLTCALDTPEPRG